MRIQHMNGARPLSWWLQNLPVLDRDAWLWIRRGAECVTVETQCWAVESDIDLSPEEQDEREAQLEKDGYQCFFYRDQLEDIRSNLESQKPTFAADDLIKAINYYWRNDAFIQIQDV